MSHSFTARLRRLVLPVALVAALPAFAQAQSGRIAGTVTDESKQPLAGASVLVRGTALGASTDAEGKYSIRGVSAGTYTLTVQRLGSKATTRVGVVVTAGQETVADITLAASTMQLGGVVISASRRIEKITDAPATVTRIEAGAIETTIGNSFAPALKDVKGLDFVQVGMTAVAVNARGFNSSFNNRMLLMEDNRIAVLPENGLPAGGFTTIPKVDLAGIEVLIGPGAALYGPDASNGVITLQTKDPKQYPGLTVEASVGNRSFMDAQARWADVFGKVGVKVTAERQQANDWENQLRYAPVVTGSTVGLPENGADFKTDVTRGSAALVYYFDRGGRFEVTGGASKSNGLGQTNVGRNQLKDWEYRNVQAKFTSPRWFAQAYQTQSLSGQTFQLNGFTQNAERNKANPAISADSNKALSDFPARGTLTAAEIQNNFDLGMIFQSGASALDNTRLVWGVQTRKDDVTSKRQWLSDRNTGKDIEVSQTGGYFQAETPLTNKLRMILAGRYDKHDKYDAQFSPKAAFTFTPLDDQTFRVSFNRAFKSPSLLQTDFYFPNFSPFVGIFGNERGFIVKNNAGTVVQTIAPIKPETNNTWEVGYKGILGGKLYIDIAGYHSVYQDFLSPLYVFANPLAGANATTGFYPDGSPIFTSPQIALTYLNIGEATIYGTDAGLRYYFTDRISASANLSLQKLDTIKRPATGPLATAGNEATAFNSPTTKWTAGMEFNDVIKNVIGGFTIRYVNKYDFRSGVNYGTIPTFSTFDLSASWKTPMQGVRFTAQLQNLFTCVGGTSTMPAWIAAANKAIYAKDQSCGFNKKHIEMINAPELGTMVFVGVRFDGLR